ncbi:Mating-type protein MAT alpha 1 [Penicillium malachiteum]|uniref:Mating-type protein MAT alpha 1 n=1 Tax=Penicillium malachiteum TaxID=1324776 RepID=UPI0025477695|nr:Mating-type protein MAT alpha 1 [Penicillium malachiteum]KAJ5726404.1 Mating-type protein MAT alpha 1 [Penicillium malachiteum]
MPIIFSPRWSPKTCLLFAYLTTIPLWRAIRILAFWDRRARRLEDFALDIIQGIPLLFWTVPLAIPDEPHFSIVNGHLRVLTDDESAEDPLRILPSDLEPLLAAWRPCGLTTTRPPTRLKQLNSFMVFRAFMAPLLPGLQQKNKSRVISTFWQYDPFKAQWAVLAKAYSLLRDHFILNDQTLSHFIAVTKGLFNFPTPELYLAHVGWKIYQDDDGDFELVQCSSRLTFQLPNNPVSVNDVVFFCADITGYATQRDESLWPFFVGFREDIFVLNDQGEMRDPFGWLMDDNGNLKLGPFREFHLEDLYDDPDPDMDPLNDLIFVPDYEQAREEERAAEKAAYLNQMGPLPPLEPWIHWGTILPAAPVAGQS